ncbi:ribonuclease H-like domain-containing protein [Tanacetum coccineum]|uniref:Ribonuclease H-like domain-containing protein n=1 Tax=Tanacetum coccineum TaxID=301880 RepID=A0ABQ5CXE5_9ASTR
MYNFLQKINSVKQGGSSVADYYHRLNSLWREFDAMTKLPKCTCEVKCSCDASRELGLHQQLMKLMQFLMGLDDCYQPVRSSLLTRDLIPKVKDDVIMWVYRDRIPFEWVSGVSRLEKGENSGDWLSHPADQVLFVLKVDLNMLINILWCLFVKICQRAKVLNKGNLFLSDHLQFFDNLKPLSLNDDGRDPSNVEGSLPHSDMHDSIQGRNQSDMLTATQIDDQNWSEGNVQNIIVALSDPNWVKAMNNEIEALNRNNIWTVYDSHVGRKPIGSKWIWKIKYKASGDIERYKARLVARGFSQKEGFDYDETFSPVVKMVTVRCLISIVVVNKWPLYQLDVNNAFLYGDLVEYQASRQWNAKLTIALTEHGFEQSKFDYSLYTKHRSGMFIALLVYVEDIVITGSDIDRINEFKLFLIELCCDNSSAIQIADNPVFHERTKPFELDVHFVREKVLAGVIKTVKVRELVGKVSGRKTQAPKEISILKVTISSD